MTRRQQRILALALIATFIIMWVATQDERSTPESDNGLHACRIQVVA